MSKFWPPERSVEVLPPGTYECSCPPVLHSEACISLGTLKTAELGKAIAFPLRAFSKAVEARVLGSLRGKAAAAGLVCGS